MATRPSQLDPIARRPALVPRRPTLRHRWNILLGSLGVLVAAGAILPAAYWPFTRTRVISELQEATSSKVELGSFKRTYFPHPGCVAEGLIFHRDVQKHKEALITIRQLTIASNWWGLFAKHISEIRAEGAHVVVPPFGEGQTWPIQSTSSKISIGSLVADGAILDFQPQSASRSPLRFEIKHFVIHDLGSGRSMAFETLLLNPQPPGEVHAIGYIGPWEARSPGQTPIHGSYSFQRADLSYFGGITGLLSSDGTYDGTLKALAVQGQINVPAFGLRRSGHNEPLHAQFRATVNGDNGDVTLHEVRSRLAKTEIVSHGTVAAQPGLKGKIARINSVVHEGRIEDLFYLFVKAPQSPLRGSVSFRARTILAPGDVPFLARVELSGEFGIDHGRATRAQTQQDMDRLSTQARGEKPDEAETEDVVSNLEGSVTVSDGIARFSQLSFRVPGAHAKLHGNYDLLSEGIDLQGILFMQAKLSQATSGIKSFLLKVIDPLLKKNHRGGAKVPIRISGTYDHPKYGLDPI